MRSVYRDVLIARVESVLVAAQSIGARIHSRFPAPRWLMRLCAWIARVPWSLVGFGIIGVAHAFAFSGFGTPLTRPPAGLELLSTLAPFGWGMRFYAVLWLIAGLACLVSVKWRDLTWWGLGCIVGMSGIWWSFYLGGWIADLNNEMPSRIYYIAALYLGLWLAVLGQLPAASREKDDDQ